MPLTNNFELNELIALGGIDSVVGTTRSILTQNGIQRPLFSEYEIEKLRWRERVLTTGLSFSYDDDKSIIANLLELFKQAEEIQAHNVERKFLEIMLQHLVGANLEIGLGTGSIKHSKFSVEDHLDKCHANFAINEVTIYVTTHPSEALIRKSANDLKAGLKPQIVSLRRGIQGADFLLEASYLRDRVEIVDATQHLAACVFQRSFFQKSEFDATLKTILSRYNEIVSEFETDSSLLVHF